MYVYIKSEPQLYTVGFYDPAGQWHAESDWPSAVQASERVHWLNGGASKDEIDPALAEYDWIKKTTFTDEDI